MIAYRFVKSRKWVQELSNGSWRSIPFGQLCLDDINTMLSYSDFDTYKKIYANQIAPCMLDGYSTEYGKTIVSKISSNLKSEEKMKEKFESGQRSYNCVKDFTSYLAEELPYIHLHRKEAKKELQIVYDNLYDLAFRFFREISNDEKNAVIYDDKGCIIQENLERYKNAVYSFKWQGVKVCKDEYTDGKEEIAEVFYCDTKNMRYRESLYTWIMFPLDFAELLFNLDINFMVKKCSHCGALYATSYPQSVLCECCRSNNVTNATRKNNRCRQLHKNILDLINNCKTEKHIARYAGLEPPDGTPTYFFRTESNFYWSTCRGKKPKTEKAVFYEDVTSEQQYYEWLKKIHDEIKK